MHSTKIGFIGLGRMGGRLASRLTTAGDLSVFDADPSRMAPFEGRARCATSIADLAAEVEAVGICVRDDAQVNDCVNELLTALQPGAVIMIHSTVSPDTVQAAAKRAAQTGVKVVEAGVTVTRYDEADAPFVFTLTGGDVETVESVRALLDAYSTHSVHVGDLGSGMSLKIINNLVSLVQIIVAEEAFRLAAMTSVPAEILVDVMKRNGALTPVMETIARRTGEAPPERSVQMNREVQASNGIKDLALAEQLAKSVNTASSAATFAKSQYWFSMTAHGPTGAW